MALRGLARRLAPAPFPPRHLPLPIPGTPGRLRLLSTGKKEPPHFMVEYLVTTCGLLPAAAAKAAPRFSHLSSSERPDAVIAFLRSQGLGKAQVRAIVARKPSLLLSDVDATLSPKFSAVRALGLRRADAARLFALFPPALTYGIHSNLLPRVLFWLDLLGSTTLLMKWLAKTWLLKYNVDVLLRNLAALRRLGVPEGRLNAAVRRQPTIIMQSTDKLRELAGRVEEACCGVPPSAGMYAWCLFALHNVSDRAFQAKKAAVTRALGCTDEEFAAMFRRAPCFLIAPEGLLRRKVEFLMTTVGCSAGGIVRNPLLLTLSLDKRMAPRCRAVEALRSKGVDIGMNMVGIVRLPEAVFVERYILKHKGDVTELLGLYPQARAVMDRT